MDLQKGHDSFVQQWMERGRHFIQRSLFLQFPFLLETSSRNPFREACCFNFHSFWKPDLECTKAVRSSVRGTCVQESLTLIMSCLAGSELYNICPKWSAQKNCLHGLCYKELCQESQVFFSHSQTFWTGLDWPRSRKTFWLLLCTLVHYPRSGGASFCGWNYLELCWLNLVFM